MHDGVSFDKIQPKKWVILGHELTENKLENREFGHTARSATSRFSFAGSSLEPRGFVCDDGGSECS
jgi:hypothetical protein